MIYYENEIKLHASFTSLGEKFLLDSRITTGFPLGLENLKKSEGIFQSGKSQGILNGLEESGKITQNAGKLREFEINII